VERNQAYPYLPRGMGGTGAKAITMSQLEKGNTSKWLDLNRKPAKIMSPCKALGTLGSHETTGQHNLSKL